MQRVDHQAKRYQRLADAAYEQVAQAAQGWIYSLEDVARAIVLPLDDVEARDWRFKLQLAKSADQRQIRKGHSAQRDLFSGDPEALDGYLPQGDGRRVQIRVAGNVEWLATIKLQSDNVQEVTTALHETLGQYAMIAPYLAQGMVTPEAVQAYLRDHQHKAS